MDKHDLKFMQEAIEWASDCHPVKESIPKVSAIFAVGDKALGAVAGAQAKRATTRMRNGMRYSRLKTRWVMLPTIGVGNDPRKRGV